jgi:hypothetical protein
MSSSKLGAGFPAPPCAGPQPRRALPIRGTVSSLKDYAGGLGTLHALASFSGPTSTHALASSGLPPAWGREARNARKLGNPTPVGEENTGRIALGSWT